MSCNAMNLQENNCKVRDKEHLKWYVDIPAPAIQEIKWREGYKSEIVVRDRKLVLQSKG